jgi:putative endonuclease
MVPVSSTAVLFPGKEMVDRDMGSVLRKLFKGTENRTEVRGEKKRLGARGEDVAASYLQKKGIHILQRNYRREFGEIDIVARDGKTLVFVEVKTASTNHYGLPEEWVTERKQRQIARMAAAYLQEYQLRDVDCRFDVVTVNRTRNDEINHIQNAFWIQP